MKMKKYLTGCAVLALLLNCASGVFAMEVPTETTVRNLDGVQEYIKVFTVSPDADPAALIEAPFEYNGYTYAYTDAVKQENSFSETKLYTETVTVETEKKELDDVLEAFAPSVEYDDGVFRGVLNLDHTTIQTEAKDYEWHTYTLTEVKEIGPLDGNDMSYVPQSTVKNGVTLQLGSVDWQVQGTSLVDDVLVPSSYKAVATYSGPAWYKSATGYISTADYVGEIVREGVESITYTITYTGTPIAAPEPEPEPEPSPEPTEEPAPIEPDAPNPFHSDSQEQLSIPGWVWFAAIGLLVLLAAVIILIVVIRKQGAHTKKYYEEMEDDEPYNDET